ncbi:AEC family transporter [Pararhodobacter sp. CCB-MM2]|uniref:AEC family transporter n=1 Tax=Pararhodobacter sp. CCB-MM2 TaxID=1786003 RepID=UPI000837971B|nr:AEC family transporter [Pararhodobacter sp. CCB-MM2]MCA2009882.1 AEC family transporter [Cereibacter sphaeroides]
MQALLQVILPVFLVVAAGYGAAWRNWMTEDAVDGLMKFAQSFAIPMLLFLALMRLDLGQAFDWRLLVSFYGGAISGFVAGLLGARFLFGRDWEDAVAVGFVCLFSNSMLLGVPITERAYGPEALAPNYAIISIHAPLCYLIGITAMEGVRARGAGIGRTAFKALQGMWTNPLVIGIGLGAIVNLGGITLPTVVVDAVELISRAGLPAALFGLGGVLFRYRPEGDLRLIAYATLLSLALHPTITWGLGRFFALEHGPFRSAVLTAGMAPGVNAYLFANMYGRAKRVAASTVLLATGLCVLTAWGWMTVLG